MSAQDRIRSLRLSMRFIAPLVVTLAVLGYALLPVVDRLTLRWWVNDLDTRSQLVANTLEDQLAQLVQQGATAKINTLFNRALQDQRLYALAFCDEKGKLRYETATYPQSLRCQPLSGTGADSPSVVHLPQGPLHVVAHPIYQGSDQIGSLVLVHDMSFVERRSADTRRYLIGLFVVLGVIISLVTVFIAHLSWRGWIAGARSLLRGEGILQRFGQRESSEDVHPLASDLRALLRDLDMSRRIPEDGATWSPEMLRGVLRDKLLGDEILVVSNREPFIHVHRGEAIAVQRPASGLVTALEPVMRACSGTWIAHGSGDADHDTVDAKDRVRVPPDKPSYTLRRVWLTEEEERGYYEGFANEGLWPLCHIAHVRPVFRSRDWEEYVSVNRRFAEAVRAEARTEDPVVLAQDYHLALLPRLIRERLPKATIITFWHIPWPNSESFGICPWREALLDGLLGSTILGFHTRFHCQNFVETVDRYLEARIERESSTISYGGRLTRVEHYPISIQWPPEWVDTQLPVPLCRAKVLRVEKLADDVLLGVGVDRCDYTKGILERLSAIERMLELHSELIGRFVFVQIAAPSRSSLEEYQNFEGRLRSLAARINARFGREGWEPIRLKVEHHPSHIVNEYYRAADMCVVTSLHDGMNLVAKEFIASRDDERGVLVLSQFTGAARELHDALLVNPYHSEQCAHAIYRALTMPADEQRLRMRSMRRLVQEFNVYRWAGAMLLDAARLRQRQRVSERIKEHGRTTDAVKA
ncbi:MAG: trehalose-6-phosphate synthase [Betaproteobacteria bacterium]|nr:MAG: trehalose-6-phosphate synthase [Betaproteobacteria bacterium]